MNELSLVLCWDFCCTSCFLYQVLYCPVVLLFSFLISPCFPLISLYSYYVYTSCFHVFCDANFIGYVSSSVLWSKSWTPQKWQHTRMEPRRGAWEESIASLLERCAQGVECESRTSLWFTLRVKTCRAWQSLLLWLLHWPTALSVNTLAIHSLICFSHSLQAKPLPYCNNRDKWNYPRTHPAIHRNYLNLFVSEALRVS